MGGAVALKQPQVAVSGAGLPAQPELLRDGANGVRPRAFNLDEAAVGQFVQHDLQLAQVVRSAVFLIHGADLIAQRIEKTASRGEIRYLELDLLA